MDSISFFWSFFKMLSALALVIALMIGAMIVVKKYFYHSPAVSSAHSLIDIVSTRHLGPKSSFMLIDVLGKVLLVGISNQEMSLLATITDSDSLAKLKSLQLENKASYTTPYPLHHYRSLLRSIGLRRKDD